MDLISIIIPVYNTEKFIGKAISSIIYQTYSQLEIIIVDDASTDNTFSICKQFAEKDSRIRLYKNEKNLGMMPNWNQALQYITGKYWAKLDADDWWQENFIEDCYEIISKDENIGMVCGRYIYIDENDNLVPNSEYQLPNEFKNKSTNFIWRAKKGVYGTFTPPLAQQGNGLIRTNIIEKLGNYTLLPAGDVEFYFRIGAHYTIYFIDKLYHYHRVWNNNFTRVQVLASGKSEKNLYDVKQTIFNYYFDKHIITKDEYKKFTKDNIYEFNKHTTVLDWKQKNRISAIKKIGYCFVFHPIKTFNYFIK